MLVDNMHIAKRIRPFHRQHRKGSVSLAKAQGTSFRILTDKRILAVGHGQRSARYVMVRKTAGAGAVEAAIVHVAYAGALVDRRRSRRTIRHARSRTEMQKPAFQRIIETEIVAQVVFVPGRRAVDSAALIVGRHGLGMCVVELFVVAPAVRRARVCRASRGGEALLHFRTFFDLHCAASAFRGDGEIAGKTGCAFCVGVRVAPRYFKLGDARERRADVSIGRKIQLRSGGDFYRAAAQIDPRCALRPGAGELQRSGTVDEIGQRADLRGDGQGFILAAVIYGDVLVDVFREAVVAPQTELEFEVRPLVVVVRRRKRVGGRLRSVEGDGFPDAEKLLVADRIALHGLHGN